MVFYSAGIKKKGAALFIRDRFYRLFYYFWWLDQGTYLRLGFKAEAR